MDSGDRSRRRSDVPLFVQTDVDIDALADDIFSRYVGEQDIVIDGAPSTATFFQRAYCPDFRVMKLAGRLALALNQRAAREQGSEGAIAPLRLTVEEIMLAALLHDLGKQHEDCAPFLELMKETDLRGDASIEAARRQDYLLGIIRDIHCRKGPCVIDRLRDAGRPELDNAFLVTVARRHGDDYEANRSTKDGCWWSREINVVTIADDYDAVTSEGPERAYKSRDRDRGRPRWPSCERASTGAGTKPESQRSSSRTSSASDQSRSAVSECGRDRRRRRKVATRRNEEPETHGAPAWLPDVGRHATRDRAATRTVMPAVRDACSSRMPREAITGVAPPFLRGSV